MLNAVPALFWKRLFGMVVICLTVAFAYPMSKANATAPSDVELFHDQGYIYMNPVEPSSTDPVVLMLRAKANDLDAAQIQYYDHGDSAWHVVNMSDDSADATGNYHFWKGTIPASSSKKQYRFVAVKDGVSRWYNTYGAQDEDPSTERFWDFWLIPGFSTPAWSKGALWYSIMPDSFYNSDPRGDFRTGVRQLDVQEYSADSVFYTLADNGWGNKHLGGMDWYGGDLNGIKGKLQPYMKDLLGIDALYMNPIWGTYHNAGYGQFDYTTVNPVLGTNEDLKSLISTSHNNNIKVMLDGVFKYHRQDGQWFNKAGYFPKAGAYQSTSSEYYPRFIFDEWPNNYEKSFGNPVIDFSNSAVKGAIYQNSDSAMQMYLRAPYNADGWRLDVGETLSGSGGLTSHTILKDMRQYIKSAKSDAVYMSENVSDLADITDNTLDAFWNYDFNGKVRYWMNGVLNQSGLDWWFKNYMINRPRQAILSSYTPLSTHDISRIIKDANYDSGLVNAAQIIQMTYLGAPSIYFGDETGERGDHAPQLGDAAPGSFNAFNWDRSSWDFRTFNLYRSLSELRKQFPTLKTGIAKTLLTDDTNKIYSFGRWDANNQIIVATNQNTTAQTVTISAKELSITDNTVMTDWLSGQTYVVSGGNVTVHVPAKWGAVLIAGNIALGSFRDEYEVKDIGNVPVQGSTVKESYGAFTMKGSGSIGAAADAFQFASLPAFNNFSVMTRIDSIESGSANAKAGIMIRNSSDANSKYYALFAKQSGGFGYSYRDATGEAATESFSGTTSYPTWLKVERVNNVFKAYTAPDASGSPGAWSLLSGSEKQIQMDTEVLHGLAVTSSDSSLKQAQFTGMSRTDLGKQKFDDFAGSVPGSMFSILNPDTSRLSLGGGKLNIMTTNANKNVVVASAPAGQDWSAKVKVSFTPTINGQEADLLAYQDNKNYVKVNRIRDGGVTKIGFASVINGHQQYNAMLADPDPGSDIYLQLQRIGTRYTAVYSKDGNKWSDIGTSEFANFSQTLVGMTATAADSSSATAGYDYFSFGNNIAGESGYNSSVSEGKYDLSLGVDPTTPWGRLVFGAGDWVYTEGGYSQTNSGYNKSMNFADRPYEDFYMEASLKFNAPTGWGGISFRRTNETDSYTASGYLLYLLADGRISLNKNGSNLTGANLVETGADMDKPVKLQLVAEGNRIQVFVNDGTSPVINVTDNGYSGGFVSLYTNESKVDFKNINIMPTKPVWTPFRGAWKQITGGVVINDYLGPLRNWISMTGRAFRDVVIETNIDIVESVSPNSWAGIQLHASMGKDTGEDGLLVYLRSNGNIGIKTPGTTLQEVATEANMSNPVNVKVVAQGNSYKVFVNGSGVPLIDVYNDEYPSGTLSLVSEQTKAEFTQLMVEGKSGNYAENLAKHN